jgi:hypothetical protein
VAVIQFTACLGGRESLPKYLRLWLRACFQLLQERLLVLARLHQTERRLQVQRLLELPVLLPVLLLVQIQLPELLILPVLVRQLGGSTDPNALCRMVDHLLMLQTFPS